MQTSMFCLGDVVPGLNCENHGLKLEGTSKHTCNFCSYPYKFSPIRIALLPMHQYCNYSKYVTHAAALHIPLNSIVFKNAMYYNIKSCSRTVAATRHADCSQRLKA